MVAGGESESFTLSNMVFQGTVLGPNLWGIHFSDVQDACLESGFCPLVYADDNMSSKEFAKATLPATMLREAAHCQSRVHTWGEGNQVSFDGDKEHFRIFDRTAERGGNARALGVIFHPRLSMKDAVSETVRSAKWKCASVPLWARPIWQDAFAKHHLLQIQQKNCYREDRARAAADYPMSELYLVPTT